MKYMSFNSSCSYAGIANMLEMAGFDTEDYKIALEIKLPYIFYKENNNYIAGPMLQSKKWFDLYLNTIGYELVEKSCNKEELIDNLCVPCMLGIRVTEKSKHAVVYSGKKGDKYSFINNKRKDSTEEDSYCFTKEELVLRLDDIVYYSSIKKINKAIIPDFNPLLRESLNTLDLMAEQIRLFSALNKTKEEILNSMNCLFRPLLLDGLSMAQLINNEELTDMLSALQKQFLSSIKLQQDTIVLSDYLDINLFNKAIDLYKTVIKKELNNI